MILAWASPFKLYIQLSHIILELLEFYQVLRIPCTLFSVSHVVWHGAVFKQYVTG